MHSHDPIRSVIDGLRKSTASMASEIQYLLAFDAAVSLAFAERTGCELGPGEPCTVTDAARAEEIVALFPRSGAQ